MVTLEDIKEGVNLRNIKYKVIAHILGMCKMKDSKKGWIQGVLYQEIDRYTGIMTIFCKYVEDFCKEFEFIEND